MKKKHNPGCPCCEPTCPPAEQLAVAIWGCTEDPLGFFPQGTVTLTPTGGGTPTSATLNALGVAVFTPHPGAGQYTIDYDPGGYPTGFNAKSQSLTVELTGCENSIQIQTTRAWCRYNVTVGIGCNDEDECEVLLNISSNIGVGGKNPDGTYWVDAPCPSSGTSTPNIQLASGHPGYVVTAAVIGAIGPCTTFAFASFTLGVKTPEWYCCNFGGAAYAPRKRSFLYTDPTGVSVTVHYTVSNVVFIDVPAQRTANCAAAAAPGATSQIRLEFQCLRVGGYGVGRTVQACGYTAGGKQRYALREGGPSVPGGGTTMTGAGIIPGCDLGAGVAVPFAYSWPFGAEPDPGLQGTGYITEL